MSQKETKTIILSVLKQQVENGMKKDELAVHYGLPVIQMTKVLKEAGLKIRKFHKPAFILQNDLEGSINGGNLQSISPIEEVVVEDVTTVSEEVVVDTEEVTEVTEVVEEVSTTVEEEINTVAVKEETVAPWGSEATLGGLMGE